MKHLFDQSVFKKMKNSAILINISRGGQKKSAQGKEFKVYKEREGKKGKKGREKRGNFKFSHPCSSLNLVLY